MDETLPRSIILEDGVLARCPNVSVLMEPYSRKIELCHRVDRPGLRDVQLELRGLRLYGEWAGDIDVRCDT